MSDKTHGPGATFNASVCVCRPFSSFWTLASWGSKEETSSAQSHPLETGSTLRWRCPNWKPCPQIQEIGVGFGWKLSQCHWTDLRKQENRRSNPQADFLKCLWSHSSKFLHSTWCSHQQQTFSLAPSLSWRSWRCALWWRWGKMRVSSHSGLRRQMESGRLRCFWEGYVFFLINT